VTTQQLLASGHHTAVWPQVTTQQLGLRSTHAASGLRSTSSFWPQVTTQQLGLRSPHSSFWPQVTTQQLRLRSPHSSFSSGHHTAALASGHHTAALASGHHTQQPGHRSPHSSFWPQVTTQQLLASGHPHSSFWPQVTTQQLLASGHHTAASGLRSPHTGSRPLEASRSLPVDEEICENELGLSAKSVVQWKTFCSEVCMYWMENQEPIGGPNTVVEIDKTTFGKRKVYHGVQVRCGLSVFGGIERGSGRMFIVPVEEIDSDTLAPLCQTFISGHHRLQ
ncbi:hypothetical protein Hamer_G031595, partial [Homarus americanus]